MSDGLALTRYKVLSFDCYGTLIDWEAGLVGVLSPWAREEGLNVDDEELLLAYADSEADIERERPTARYPEILAAAFRCTGEKLGREVSNERAAQLSRSVLGELGLARTDLVHVAQSLFHDHVPAKREGLPSIWINRRHDRSGWGATPEPSQEWSCNLEFTSMATLADATDRAFDGSHTERP
jgi:FMN phosphatase YigB (HAD superfamily)